MRKTCTTSFELARISKKRLKKICSNSESACWAVFRILNYCQLYSLFCNPLVPTLYIYIYINIYIYGSTTSELKNRLWVREGHTFTKAYCYYTRTHCLILQPTRGHSVYILINISKWVYMYDEYSNINTMW